MRTKGLDRRIEVLSQRMPDYAETLAQAMAYTESDPQSSLTKSRSALERLVMDAYQRELGEPPRKSLLGEMLNQRAFTDKVERRIVSRMNSIRDMGNLGPHGEEVHTSDAERVLYDVCDVFDWYLDRYPQAATPSAESPPEAPPPPARVPRRLMILAIASSAAMVIGVVGFLLVARRTSESGASAAPVEVTAPAADAGFGVAPVALRWQPVAGAAEYRVELVQIDAAGHPVGAPSTARVPLAYVMWPWDGAAPAAGRYRFRVEVAGRPATASPPRVFSFYPSALDRVLESGRLRVGMEITYHRPFAYYDVDAGQVTGFDVELATELARRLGVEREPVALPWDDLFAAVEDDRVDVVISAVTITEERARRHGFSRPYFTTGQRLTARAADRRDFAAGSKASVGTQKGTSSETAARALPGAEVRVYDTLDLALAALSSSEIDLLVCDEALSPARSDPAFRFVGERLTSESYGVMMPRDDRPLAERVDAILGQLETEGWLAALAARYGIGGGTE